MKKILITGKNSYIGTSLERWLLKHPDSYKVETLDLLNEDWKSHNFSNYDVVFHVAGIAHIKETPENNNLFYRVNHDLTLEVAKKSKEAGVKQFIFLSSMSVYGLEAGFITKETIPTPNTAYAKSKLAAEIELAKIRANNFKIAILRPPMVYGANCKGNYPRLSTLSKKIPFFFDSGNSRSMIYIENLCEFVKQIIDSFSAGLFFPQNKEYVNTADMVKTIAKSHGKAIRLIKIPRYIIKFFNISLFNKVFGNLCYDFSLSNSITFNYNIVDFETSVHKTESNS